ncbi:MAG: hypothetical protein HFF18_13995 [Oscillospiraceae bacterium]|nr:hypothetical protein [Oscillospiraceae bacterium]
MKADSKTLRLFGHWEDVRIQGTDRTYRIYACHPLDRILTIALILAVWAAVFLFFFCRSPKPRGIGVLLRGLGVIYLPAEIGPFIRLFLFWMAIPGVPSITVHGLEHWRQRRILRGELTARQGVLTKIGYSQYRSRGGITKWYRFLLEAKHPRSRKVVREVYKMPEHLFKEFEGRRQIPHACRVELVLLPPEKQKEARSMAFFDGCIDMLSMRVEHIFYLEDLPACCVPVEDLLFVPKRYGKRGAPKPCKRKHGK